MKKILPNKIYRDLKFKGTCPKCDFQGEEYYHGMGWIPFMASYKLTVIGIALRGGSSALSHKLWDLQDGFGPCNPEACGWDWSAIRDSSPKAINAMFKVAKKAVNMTAFKEDLTHGTGHYAGPPVVKPTTPLTIKRLR
jgi:hypothetical protein